MRDGINPTYLGMLSFADTTNNLLSHPTVDADGVNSLSYADCSICRDIAYS